MLTPQEVSEHAFSKVSFGGYNMAMVDDFLDILTTDYTALYNENAVLKSKMKVLVDKVEEYRATEEAMRKALMSAQRMADQLVQEAQEKKQAILQQAEREAAEQTAEIHRQAEVEQARLVAAQQATAAYVQQVRQLHAGVLSYLDHLDEITPEVEPAPAPLTREEEAAQEIEDSVQRILEAQLSAVRQELSDEVDEPTTDLNLDLDRTADFTLDREPSLFDEDDPPFEDEDADKTQVIHRDFGPLEFGRDYEIK